MSWTRWELTDQGRASRAASDGLLESSKRDAKNRPTGGFEAIQDLRGACDIGERCGVATAVARLATASGIQSGAMPVRTLWPASRSRTATAVGLTLALGGPPVIAAWSGTYGPAASLSIQLPLQLVFCTLAVVVLLIVSRWEQLPLASIGLRRPDVMTVAVAVTILLLAYHVLPLLTTPLLRVLGLGGFERGLEALANQPRWWRVCLALTSGPVENCTGDTPLNASAP